MNMTEFAAQVRHEDGLAVIALAGQISGAAEAGLNEAYAGVAGEPRVLLDFSAVDYINSTGIAVIVGILAEARKNGQSLEAGGLAEHYREIFRITRLSDFMTILEDGE
ncbi:MAG TPA: STAS domain-containing protein [Gaiellaceae bacterium]|jgi:anti-anti-sigma factor|nr:STAS domain-containing protein [Gaiellaceae bacterium]